MTKEQAAATRAAYQRLLQADSQTLRRLALASLQVGIDRTAAVSTLGGAWAGRWESAKGLLEETRQHINEGDRAAEEIVKRRQYAQAVMSADLLLLTLKEEEAAGSTASQIVGDGGAAVAALAAEAARKAAAGAVDLIPADVKIAAAVAGGAVVLISLLALVTALAKEPPAPRDPSMP